MHQPCDRLHVFRDGQQTIVRQMRLNTQTYTTHYLFKYTVYPTSRITWLMVYNKF